MSEETQDPARNPSPSEPVRNAEEPAPAGEAAEATETAAPGYDFVIEDAGLLKKKVTVTVTRARIDAKLDEMFGELAGSAQVPGFRVGHAPRRLIEKRFGKEITTDVRNALVGEALNGLAEKKKDLHAISQPDLKLDDIKLPDTGDMSFSFELEVAPEFDLPALEGIEVKKAALEITEARVDEAVENLRGRHAKYEPTEDAAREGDVVLAGAKITGEGIEPLEQHGLTLRVAPAQIEGLPLLDLGKDLSGKKAGEAVTMKVKAPEAHPTEAWRNKELTVELTVSQVRRTVLPEINDEWAKAQGLESMAQLREYMKTNLQGRLEYEVQRDLRTQICKHLLETIPFEVPEGVVARHAQQLLLRRYIDLMQQGVPQEKIDENLVQMQAAIGEQAKADLRLSFILGKLADREEIEVGEYEINSRVAAVAQQQNQRPERLRQKMEADGSLSTLVDNLREEKALDRLLEKAKITEGTPEAPAGEAQGETKAQ